MFVYLRILITASLSIFGLVLMSSPIFAQYNENTHQIYMVDDGVIKIYDENLIFQSKAALYTDEYTQILDVSPSHDFSKIAVVRDDGTVDIFSLPDFIWISQTEASGGALWSRDNIHFIAWQTTSQRSTNLLVINAVAGKTVDKKEFETNVIGIIGPLLNPTDNTVLLFTGVWELWNIFDGMELLDEFGRGLAPSFSPDGQFLALANEYTGIEIIRLSDHSVVNTIDFDLFEIIDMHWTAKGLFVPSFDWNSSLFDPFTDEIFWSIPSGFVEDVIWTEDGSRFYKIDLSQGTTAHDGNTGAFIARMMPDLIATFTPDPNWLVPTASDSTYFTPAPIVTATPR